MNSLKVGIMGGAGYTGGELLRLLLHHPAVSISFVHSNSQAGKPLHHAHPDLLGDTTLLFSAAFHTEIDLLFLCMGHGEAGKFLTANAIPKDVKIIDLSHDFRDESQGFVYGLPELKKAAIQQADRIANPGCFATAIQLALLPAIAQGWIRKDVHVSGITGSTGAGKGLADTSHFSWRNQNTSVYKLFNHQHLIEIGRNFQLLNTAVTPKIRFVPYRGNFSRGIWITAYFDFEGSEADALETFEAYYKDAPFTWVSDQDIQLKHVVNTNKCVVQVQKQDGQLVVFSAIDNLLKGASGQAVQNMNLMYGFEESLGLKLKASAF